LLKNTKYGNLFTLNSPATSCVVGDDGNHGVGNLMMTMMMMTMVAVLVVW
jgi:hypothetical protein